MNIVDALCEYEPCQQPLRWLTGTPRFHRVCFETFLQELSAQEPVREQAGLSPIVVSVAGVQTDAWSFDDGGER